MRRDRRHRRGLAGALVGIVLFAWLAACERTPSELTRLAPDTTGSDSTADASARPYVVLLSLDGFHPAYLDLTTVHLSRIMQRGVRAEALEPVFPTLTFPNHISQVTGLYPERHGIVANAFFDPARQQWYSLGNRAAVQDATWYRGEPIWVTAEKQGVRTGSYYWPGSEAAIGGVRPTYWKVYDGSVPNAARVDSVLAWLRLEPDRRPHFVTLYMSDVDSEGHRAGPHAPGIRNAVSTVDFALGRLLDGLDQLPQGDSIYLVIVSDHGMARYETEHFEAMDEHISMSGVIVGAAGAYASLHATRGAAHAVELRDQLNAGLQHGRAYLRTETPAHLRYRADPRIGDVVVIMDEPYQIREAYRAPAYGGGTHGWEPTTAAMQGIFLVSGPGIPRGKRIASVRSVDLYPFLAEILGLEPNPGIDGEAGAIRAAIDN